METATVAKVNRAMAKMGRAERLTRGRGYYYWRGGEAFEGNDWPSIMSNRIDAYTLDEVLAEARENIAKSEAARLAREPKPADPIKIR